MQHLINIARYTEAVALFKTASDAVWYASALEGLATIALLEAWSGQGLVRSVVILRPLISGSYNELTACLHQRRQRTLG
jgi:Transport protein Trs120 or TRAPPC9, TRAPP II complex subunit